MGIIVITLLLISAIFLIISRRNTETILISALILSLAEFWYVMLIYIAKKGGFSVHTQTLLYGTREIRLHLQYLIFTLGRLGFVIAIGRYIFPLILMWLAVYYSMRVPEEKKARLCALFAVIPFLMLVIYYPRIFKWIIRQNSEMVMILPRCSLFFVLAYIIIAMLLILREWRDISMRFYRRQFAGRVMMILSLVILYVLYCPQDPAQVYLFYNNEYMGSRLGLWYLNPALNPGTYIIAFSLVIICTIIGVFCILRYARENILEGIEENTISRKFDTASKGASVFVHSVKNQLLANRVLLKRADAEISKPDPDLEAVRNYHQQLSQNNTFMIERMEELYRSVRTNSIILAEENLRSVFEDGLGLFHKKYPDARVIYSIPEDLTVLYDRNYLAEAIQNLLLNGWEAQIDPVRTDFPLEVSAHNERLLTVIEITDHGTGLSDEQRKHIFEPFWSSKNSNYNWGMGLYYTRQIIRSHLGTLRLETHPGTGTVFIIQLPRQTAVREKTEP